jgi:hypothetical protein
MIASSTAGGNRTGAVVAAGLAALWVFGAGLQWGTLTAGGADAHGYVSQASLWLRRDLVIEQPIAREVPWPDADWTFSPLGYRPGQQSGTIVPIYPAGLPIAMAFAQAIAGPRAVFVVVPLLGAVFVVAGAAFAWRMSTPTAGALAALLLASSPTVLFSVMWPMSDVPAAAWWAVALLLATGAGTGSAIGSGVSAALAILTRPNLVGLALVPGLYLAERFRAGPNRGMAFIRLGLFGTISAVGCVGVAAIHTWLYGSPFATGHGDLANLFSLSRLPTTLWGFVTRPLRVEPILVLLGLTGLTIQLRRRDNGEARALTWLALGVAGLVFVSYAFYFTFPDWWYLRLLLPLYPGLAALAGTGAVWLAGLVPHRHRVAAVSLMACAIVGAGLWQAVERGVFRLEQEESRYAVVGRFVSRTLPPNAALFSFQESGSLRYYGQRLTLRYDVLAPEWLERALTLMQSQGYRPYFVLEEQEVPIFRDRFQDSSALGRLDWPAAAELKEGPVWVQIFDPSDRARSKNGHEVATRMIDP